MNRKLFKYVEYDPETEHSTYEQLAAIFLKNNIDPDYYLVIDSTKDLPYDVYRSTDGRVPIYLRMPSGEKKELSTHSVIVEAITGKTREDHKLYFAVELINKIKNDSDRFQIQQLLGLD